MLSYKTSEQLLEILKILFNQINADYPEITQGLYKSNLSIRLKFIEPPAELFIDAKHNPVEISYGKSTKRSVLSVILPTTMLHGIMMGEMSLKEAFGTGKIKIKGPFWKALILEDIFRKGQEIYPRILQEVGLISEN